MLHVTSSYDEGCYCAFYEQHRYDIADVVQNPSTDIATSAEIQE